MFAGALLIITFTPLTLTSFWKVASGLGTLTMKQNFVKNADDVDVDGGDDVDCGAMVNKGCDNFILGFSKRVGHSSSSLSSS